MLFLGMIAYVLLPSVNVPYIQRALIAKNKSQLTQTFTITGLFHLPFILVMSLIGLTLVVLYSKVPSNIVLYHFIGNVPVIGVMGLLISGMIAITMSTQDSYLNAGKHSLKRFPDPSLSYSHRLVSSNQ